MDFVKSSRFSTILISITGILGLIILFFIYSHQLDHPDSGFYCDEAAKGFNAYCIANTLRDENNQLLPVDIYSLGGYKPSINIYMIAVFVKLFGLSIFTTRIVGVLCAVLSVAFMYKVTSLAYGRFIGYTAAVFLALCPGFFHMQRLAFEVAPFTVLMLATLYHFLKYLRTQKIIHYSLTCLFFVLTWYSYMPARVFIVTTLLLTCLFCIKKIFNNIKKIQPNHLLKYGLPAALIALIIIVPELLLNPAFIETYHFQIKFLFGHTIDDVNNSFAIINTRDNLPFIYNMIQESPKFIKEIYISLYNYFSCYSPDMLFFKGDGHERHIVPNFGPLPLIFMFCTPIGFIYTLTQLKEVKSRFLIAYLFAIGIPSSMVIDRIVLHHIVEIYPFYSLIAAIGLCTLITFIIQMIQKIENKGVQYALYTLPTLLYSFVTLLMIISFGLYLGSYFTTYRDNSSEAFQAYRDKVVDYIATQSKNYNKIYLTGQVHEIAQHLLFYACVRGDFDVTKYQKDKTFPYNVEMLRHFLEIPKVQADSIREFYGDHILLILNEKELPEYPVKDRLQYANGNTIAVSKEF